MCHPSASYRPSQFRVELFQNNGENLWPIGGRINGIPRRHYSNKKGVECVSKYTDSNTTSIELRKWGQCQTSNQPTITNKQEASEQVLCSAIDKFSLDVLKNG